MDFIAEPIKKTFNVGNNAKVKVPRNNSKFIQSLLKKPFGVKK